MNDKYYMPIVSIIFIKFPMYQWFDLHLKRRIQRGGRVSAPLALENASSAAHNLLRREEEEELKDHAEYSTL